MLTIKDVVKLARGPNSVPALRSVVFDGKSAICAAELDWIVGVPCLQPALSAPVVVPVEALQAHMAKSRHLVVMPDHLTNGQGLVTPFGKSDKVPYDMVLDVLPKVPEGEAITFGLGLDALDRVLIAAGTQDIRYFLNGVHFDLSGGMLVGTDGHRLHCYANQVPQAFPESEAVAFGLARGPLRWMLSSAADTVHMTVWNAKGCDTKDAPGVPQVLLHGVDGFVWIRKPLGGRYPDWRRVVPSVASRPAWSTLNPVELANVAGAMGKVVELRKQKWPVVVVDFGAGAVLPSLDEDGMPVAVVVEGDRAAIKGDMVMAVCPGYLQDVADCVTAAARWYVHPTMPETQGLLVVDGDFSGVVMPATLAKPTAQAVAPEPVPDAVPAAEPETAPQTAQDEAPEPEPCPAAVADVVAQLVGRMKEPAPVAPKARKSRKAEPVAA